MSSNEQKILCLNCKGPTTHSVQKEYSQKQEGEDADWYAEYQILTCAGCGTVTFRQAAGSSDSIDEQGIMHQDVKLYPLRHASSRSTKTLLNTPHHLRRLYAEVIESYNTDLPIVCAAGLRALVEGICAERRITDGPVPINPQNPGAGTRRVSNLAGKIAGLAERNVLTNDHANALNKHRFLGNDAVHELKVPATESLEAAIEIIEHTIENIYELPVQAAKIHEKK